VATNTKHRADLTCLAVECGAKAIMTEKPMAHTLEEADRMVNTCAEAGVPLVCGSTSTTHPSFAVAKRLLNEGAIGELISIETPGPFGQHQNWSYFLDRLPSAVVGIGDTPRAESGSDEFRGSGMAWAEGVSVHFRHGAPGVRLTGEKGEMIFDFDKHWRLWRDVEVEGVSKGRAGLPWPTPNFNVPYGAIYCLDDALACLAGELDEPKNSGRRVRIALEVELALKESSSQGGSRIDLPLADRSLGLQYDWFR
jgi:predicted dehydrogenase